MPAALNHSAMSRLTAAPEMKKRTRPPKRSRIFEKTSLSKSVCCRDSGSGLALALELLDLEADLEGLGVDLLQARPRTLHRRDPAVGLLEDPGRRP